MSDDQPESSAQALERYLVDQLSGLSLNVPPDDLELMAQFIEEEGMEAEDKVEGVKGMLEGVVEDGNLPDNVDSVLRAAVDEWARLQDEEAARLAALAPESPPAAAGPLPVEPKPQLSEKEIAKLHAMKYAYVEGELAELWVEDRPDGAPPRHAGMSEAEAKKAAEERKAQVMDALRLDGKKKKYKKQQEVDLLAPNLNRDKVHMMAQMQREAQKKAAQTVRDRDKAALDKQRADQAKAKADKQKKAAKQERRG